MTGHLLAVLCILALVPRYASKEEPVRIEIGRALPSEMGLVFNSWKQSALDAPHNDPVKASGMIGEFFTRYNRIVQHALDTQPLVLVAREATDPDFAYGWMAAGVYGGELAILYCYTKYKFRRLGIARDLKDQIVELAPDNARPVYCARSAHDHIFEGWGFQFRELEDVIGKASNEQRVRRTG